MRVPIGFSVCHQDFHAFTGLQGVSRTLRIRCTILFECLDQKGIDSRLKWVVSSLGASVPNSAYGRISKT